MSSFLLPGFSLGLVGGVTHLVGPVDTGFGATDKSRVAESVTAVILSFAICDKVAIHRQQVRSWNHPTNRLWG